ncbi:hypothetical protein [Tardiphaga sp. 813_E8_N1_3]|uniref:hypothetical protein n=1 Tax=Tardiphaga sp. 813_E8_N1_3 TaxID=3240760 RepID=UPI003F27C333
MDITKGVVRQSEQEDVLDMGMPRCLNFAGILNRLIKSACRNMLKKLSDIFSYLSLFAALISRHALVITS